MAGFSTLPRISGSVVDPVNPYLINGFLDPYPYILNYGSGSGGPAPDPRDLSRLEEVLEKSPIFQKF